MSSHHNDRPLIPYCRRERKREREGGREGGREREEGGGKEGGRERFGCNNNTTHTLLISSPPGD